MAIRLNTGLQNAISAAFAARFSGTTDILRVYTGAQPATGNTAASGTLLVTITINTGWNAAVAGVSGLNVVSPNTGVAVATGTAGWARLINVGLTENVDGTVGTTGTDFTINTAAITSGATITLTGCNITQPAS
jgi:hypothetical protein